MLRWKCAHSPARPLASHHLGGLGPRHRGGGRAGHAPLPSAGAAKAWAKYRTVKSGKFPSRTSQLLFIKAAAFIRAERESEEGSHKLGEAKRSSVSGLKTVPCP